MRAGGTVIVRSRRLVGRSVRRRSGIVWLVVVGRWGGVGRCWVVVVAVRHHY